MHLRMLCVGRLKASPERELVDDYLLRARKLGTGLGWRSVEEVEVTSGGGVDKECERMLEKCTDGAVLIRLDERGKPWRSSDFSQRLSSWRDGGQGVDFIIGGADGLSDRVAARANHSFAFGPQTWPHKMVRVMLAEQIYRALSIEAGTPYHRE